ncbi:hypothetical protein DM806_17495 [Sphingobium lactosutens]|uniref:TetR/AcrR family transcriptional regulator n=1 Tax=Sphingobium lactosutens TaxID=522773 RepID=UPI0015BB2507|nr:TetR/AcrR family transcriptional regulator [Sphingobium lactosutens]NWK97429.1 hypothetical protein [Sphingobium lactosutens]
MSRIARRDQAHIIVERLLDAAISLIGERGFIGTTIDHIAQRSGLSHGTFYNHFADKTDILRRILPFISRKMFGYVNSNLVLSGSEHDREKERLRRFLRFSQIHPHYRRICAECRVFIPSSYRKYGRDFVEHYIQFMRPLSDDWDDNLADMQATIRTIMEASNYLASVCADDPSIDEATCERLITLYGMFVEAGLFNVITKLNLVSFQSAQPPEPSAAGIAYDRLQLRILSAAEKIVGKVGYEDCSISEIVKHASMSKTTFYKAFANIQDVFDNLLPFSTQKMLSYVDSQSNDAHQGLEREGERFESFIIYVIGNPEFINIFTQSAVFAPTAFRKYRNLIHISYLSYLRRHANSNSPQVLLDQSLLAHIVIGFRLSSILESTSTDLREDYDSIALLYERIVQRGVFTNWRFNPAIS